MLLLNWILLPKKHHHSSTKPTISIYVYLRNIYSKSTKPVLFSCATFPFGFLLSSCLLRKVRSWPWASHNHRTWKRYLHWPRHGMLTWRVHGSLWEVIHGNHNSLCMETIPNLHCIYCLNHIILPVSWLFPKHQSIVFQASKFRFELGNMVKWSIKH